MIHVSLITPEKVQFNGSADAVSMPTQTGYIQVLTNHIPMVSILSPGEVLVVQGEKVTALSVSEGYIEVRPNNEVVILANTAEHASEIDIDRAEAARIRARELFKDGRIADDQQYAQVMAALEKEFARIRVARKHVSHRRPGIGV